MSAAEMREALKPCPFCGGEASKVVTFTGAFWFQCAGCGAQGPHKGVGDLEIAWNRRAPLPDEDGMVEMREALEQAYTEGFRDGAYDSKDLPRSWKNSDTARFAASLPDEKGMVERVARALWENNTARTPLPEKYWLAGKAHWVSQARAAISTINGGKP